MSFICVNLDSFIAAILLCDNEMCLRFRLIPGILPAVLIQLQPCSWTLVRLFLNSTLSSSNSTTGPLTIEFGAQDPSFQRHTCPSINHHYSPSRIQLFRKASVLCMTEKEFLCQQDIALLFPLPSCNQRDVTINPPNGVQNMSYR